MRSVRLEVNCSVKIVLRSLQCGILVRVGIVESGLWQADCCIHQLTGRKLLAMVSIVLIVRGGRCRILLQTIAVVRLVDEHELVQVLYLMCIVVTRCVVHIEG